MLPACACLVMVKCGERLLGQNEQNTQKTGYKPGRGGASRKRVGSLDPILHKLHLEGE